MNLRGNTIFITGGGSGIGRGLAEAFHKLGNKVIVGGRRAAVLDHTVAANPSMDAIVVDTSSEESVQAAACALVRKYPELNVVINNAGVQRAVDFASDEPLDRTAVAEEINTNIYGVIRVTAAFLPHLKSRPGAVIINVSSGLAFIPMARFPVYCGTKAFVHSFTISLRHQLKGTGVHVIELAPPWVETDLDANHRDLPSLAAAERAGPMSLASFIAAAMQELASDAQELPVAQAKFLYGAGIGERASTVFAQMNR